MPSPAFPTRRIRPSASTGSQPHGRCVTPSPSYLAHVSEVPQRRFTRANRADIAHQVAGTAGGLDLVFVPGWVSPFTDIVGSTQELAGSGRCRK